MTTYAPVFDKVTDPCREDEIRSFVADNLHLLAPFEDDWYGNDVLDLNAWTTDDASYFVVYPVRDGMPDVRALLARGRIVEQEGGDNN